MTTPCRLITRVATLYTQSADWGTCPATRDGKSRHWRQVDQMQIPVSDPGHTPWPAPEIAYDWTPETCQRCGAVYDGAELWRGAGTHPIFDTPTGRPSPGDMYLLGRGGYLHHNGECHFWDNCDGRHLHVVLPNGNDWDIDSRASNCDQPDERTHRCWTRTGEPPNVTVGKSGRTCGAGAGSILSGDYHGFLRDGQLVPC